MHKYTVTPVLESVHLDLETGFLDLCNHEVEDLIREGELALRGLRPRDELDISCLDVDFSDKDAALDYYRREYRHAI